MLRVKSLLLLGESAAPVALFSLVLVIALADFLTFSISLFVSLSLYLYLKAGSMNGDPGWAVEEEEEENSSTD